MLLLKAQANLKLYQSQDQSCLGLSGFFFLNPQRFPFCGGEVSCTAQHFIYSLAIRLVSKLKKKMDFLYTEHKLKKLQNGHLSYRMDANWIMNVPPG